VTGTQTIEATDVALRLDLSSADRWHLLLLNDDRPVASIDLPSPGAHMEGALLSAAVLRWADWEAAYDQLGRRLRARLRMSDPIKPPPLRCSVVVCTRRRPTELAGLLATLGKLAPAPSEVIVVDNDPGEEDCRAMVLAAGARYVREDRRGLNNARNAGIRAARGSVVVFTDDDCLVPVGWLARLPFEFADPAVGVLTGPGFPHVLDTPSCRRMERQASLARGLRRLEFDWTVFSVAGAGAVGVGANMAFRREVLAELGDAPFPPELDAGTATESGGDTYVIAKVLAHGHRAVYDPSTFVYHRHRKDAQALHHAMFGYGVGLSAALTKLLLEDHELSAPAIWLWLLKQYFRTQLRRLGGRADSVETRLSWDYVRGGLIGPMRWMRARREAAIYSHHELSSSAVDAATPASEIIPMCDSEGDSVDREASASPLEATSTSATGNPLDALLVSVIIPTRERPDALRRCLAALAAQDLDFDRYEVLVVDDSPDGSAQSTPWQTQGGMRLRVLQTNGRGAAAARNAGAADARAALLLFLDDDVVPEPSLLRRHLRRHERNQRDLAVVGSYPPHPATRSLATSSAALWWKDFFQAMSHNRAPLYVSALTGNLSVSKQAFERSGGFDERFGPYRREDWEWGLRALQADIDLVYEPEAVGLHEYALTTAGWLQGAEREGHGDVLFLGGHRDAPAGVLPLACDPRLSSDSERRFRRAAWNSSLFRRAVVAALELLERGGLRLAWVRLFNIAHRLSYERGVRAAGAGLARDMREPLLDVDLDGDAPIAVPTLVAPTLRVRVHGEEVARVRPAHGQWTPELAEQILQAVPWPAIERVAAAAGCLPNRPEAHGHTSATQIVFGPAHARSDSIHRSRLRARGVIVSLADGPPEKHWRATERVLQQAGPAFVAMTLPGVQPDPRWLEQALVAFDGARVGVVLGRGLPDDAAPAPLLLHSRGGADGRALDSTIAPQYVIFRRELLPALAVDSAELGILAPILALVEDALEDGWVVGYRDVHGLSGAGVRRFDGARALTAVRIKRSPRRATAARAELRASTALVFRQLMRREQRRAAAEAYAGAMAGFLSTTTWGGRPL
jgi:GT2 family glycosyltransferase